MQKPAIVSTIFGENGRPTKVNWPVRVDELHPRRAGSLGTVCMCTYAPMVVEWTLG